MLAVGNGFFFCCGGMWAVIVGRCSLAVLARLAVPGVSRLPASTALRRPVLGVTRRLLYLIKAIL